MQRSRVDQIIVAMCAPRILGLQGTALSRLPAELLPAIRRMLGSRTMSDEEMADEELFGELRREVMALFVAPRQMIFRISA